MTIKDFYHPGPQAYEEAYGVNWKAQSFKATSNYLLNAIILNIYRIGSPGTLTVSIRETLPYYSFFPTGPDLCSGTIDGNSLISSFHAPWGTFYSISMGAGLAVTAGTHYAIVIRAAGGNYSNKIRWIVYSIGVPYTDGLGFYSTDSGASWTGGPGINHCFDFITLADEDPPSPNFPNNPDYITDITKISAVANAEITDIGDADVTQHGFCWNTTGAPTIADNHTENGAAAVGPFSSDITGLLPGTTYYIRAYATNIWGTGYGPQEWQFTTLFEVPIVQTDPATGVT